MTADLSKLWLESEQTDFSVAVSGRERTGPQVVEADSELGRSAGDDVDCNLDEFVGELPEDRPHDAVGQTAETFGQPGCDLDMSPVKQQQIGAGPLLTSPFVSPIRDVMLT